MSLFKCITGLVSENPLALNVLMSHKKLLKFGEKYFYPTFSSLWEKLSSKKFYLIESEILGLFDNTLTANYENSCSNREYLPLQIHINLPKKQ